MITYVNGPMDGHQEFSSSGEVHRFRYGLTHIEYKVMHDRGLALLVLDQQGNRYRWNMVAGTTRYASDSVKRLREHLAKQAHPATIKITRHGRVLLGVGFKPVQV